MNNMYSYLDEYVLAKKALQMVEECHKKTISSLDACTNKSTVNSVGGFSEMYLKLRADPEKDSSKTGNYKRLLSTELQNEGLALLHEKEKLYFDTTHRALEKTVTKDLTSNTSEHALYHGLNEVTHHHPSFEMSTDLLLSDPRTVSLLKRQIIHEKKVINHLAEYFGIIKSAVDSIDLIGDYSVPHNPEIAIKQYSTFNGFSRK